MEPARVFSMGTTPKRASPRLTASKTSSRVSRGSNFAIDVSRSMAASSLFAPRVPWYAASKISLILRMLSVNYFPGGCYEPDDHFQTTRWKRMLRLLCRARSGREGAGSRRDTGMVGTQRSNQRRGESPCSRRLQGIGPRSLPRQTGARRKRSRAPHDQPQFRRCRRPGYSRSRAVPEVRRRKSRRYGFLHGRRADDPVRRIRP